MPRITGNILICILILAVTHPYAFFSYVFSPLHVTIYWDAKDQDEDIFVSRSNAKDGSVTMVYQEESKRDQDQKSKLKLKIKIVFIPFAGPLVGIFPTAVQSGCSSSFVQLQSFINPQFHPPNPIV